MNPKARLRSLLGTAALVAIPALAPAQDLPSQAEMWAIIQQQQAEIAALKERLGMAETAVAEASQAVAATEQKVEATSLYVEEMAGGAAGSGSGADTGAGGGRRWFQRSQLGGYGELHINMGRKDMIDFHRWVLFFSHDYTENIRMFSEFELEHSLAGDGKPGEVELEQAYIEMDLSEFESLKAGLFLLPIGILNEVHEPDTFYGVERNRIENAIIPTTWWEAGAAYSRRNDAGFAFDIAAHSGLFVPTSGSNAFRIRSGRQKVAEAEFSDPAFTTRVTYTGIPGARLGASLQYQVDLAQGMFSETIGATLFETHADLQQGPWGFRALYARWDLDGDAPAATGADEQWGFYLEPSYRIDSEYGDFGFFARYSQYDTSAGAGADSDDAFFDVGMNYWPTPNVVFKWDVQFTDFADASKDEEIVNLGVGYQF